MNSTGPLALLTTFAILLLGIAAIRVLETVFSMGTNYTM
jgi:hypothetical protein